ncbi:unnamed protein product, partial [Closterium sp. Naga37s-1]
PMPPIPIAIPLLHSVSPSPSLLPLSPSLPLSSLIIFLFPPPPYAFPRPFLPPVLSSPTLSHSFPPCSCPSHRFSPYLLRSPSTAAAIPFLSHCCAESLYRDQPRGEKSLCRCPREALERIGRVPGVAPGRAGAGQRGAHRHRPAGRTRALGRGARVDAGQRGARWRWAVGRARALGSGTRAGAGQRGVRWRWAARFALALGSRARAGAVQRGTPFLPYAVDPLAIHAAMAEEVDEYPSSSHSTRRVSPYLINLASTFPCPHRCRPHLPLA